MALNFTDGYHIVGPVGVCIIHLCPSIWPSDQTKNKCHNPPNRFSHPVEDYLPVADKNQLTYRNKHCAVCHGTRNYSSWNITVKTFVTPPAEYDLDAKPRFVVDNGGAIMHIGPMENQPRQYCAGDNVDGYNKTSQIKYNEFFDAPLGPMVKRYYFKNKAYDGRNNDTGTIVWRSSLSCGGFSKGFSIAFNFRNPDVSPTSHIISKHCLPGTVYHETLQFCREVHITSVERNLSNEFLVVLWLRLTSVTNNIPTFQRFMRKA